MEQRQLIDRVTNEHGHGMKHSAISLSTDFSNDQMKNTVKGTLAGLGVIGTTVFVGIVVIKIGYAATRITPMAPGSLLGQQSLG